MLWFRKDGRKFLSATFVLMSRGSRRIRVEFIVVHIAVLRRDDDGQFGVGRKAEACVT